MAIELMWVCGILPDGLNRKVVETCREENRDIGLPETVFRFPMHISMKKSFNTDNFESVKKAVASYIERNRTISCRTGKPIENKGMIWLPIIPDQEISNWHKGLDDMLRDNFNIPVLGYDKFFKPHVSLFTKGDSDKIDIMFERLCKTLPEMDFTIRRFVVGSSRHKDEYFEF